MLFNDRSRKSASRPKTHRRSNVRFRNLTVEALEDKRLLTTLTVTSLSDGTLANLAWDGELSLREAIEAANLDTSVDGSPAGSGADRIEFAPGLAGGTITLAGTELTISDDLTIAGLGADQLTVRGKGDSFTAGRVFWVNPSITVEIVDLTISQGRAVGESGGGIHNEGTLRVANSVLSNNWAYYGGAISNEGSLTIEDCSISNSLVLEGSAIWNKGLLVISDSSFMDNESFNDGAAIWNDSFLEISSTTFQGNSAGTTILGNDAGSGGAIWNAGDVSIFDSAFSENTATYKGGAITNEGTLAISKSTFSGNIAHGTQAEGGAIRNAGTLAISESTFSQNVADRWGGGISNAGELEVTTSDFSNNSSSIGGGIDNWAHASISDSTFVKNTTSYSGGGITNSGLMEITKTTFSENTANNVGGGIWNSGGVLDITEGTFTNNSTIVRTNDGNGGAIGNRYGGRVTVSDSIFTGNAAGTGGAIDNLNFDTGSLDIINSTLTGNSSDGNGGAIWSNGPATITGSTISGNESGLYGGGVHTRLETLTVVDSSLFNNTARFGGGLDVGWRGTAEISGSTIAGNFADEEGGGIRIDEGTLKMTNSTISGNSTDGVGGGIWNFGTVETTNVTIVLNRADAGGNSAGDAGGIFNDSSVVLLNNTLVAGNSLGALGSDGPNDIGGSNIDVASSHNLIGDAATAGGLTHGANGNIVGNAGSGTIDINTVLDTTLADNGGPTLTHALLLDGPAVNAGENNNAVDADGNPLVFDERGDGFARIYAGIVDIGAFEVQTQLVQIDVKPGDDLSSVNLASNGVIAVAIFTTEDFDASQVDVSTIRFAEACAVHSALEDVDGDGDLDMVLHFLVEDTNLEEVYADLLSADSESNHQSLAVSLTGATLEGTSITGSDGVDVFFSGKALRELLDELAMAGVL